MEGVVMTRKLIEQMLNALEYHQLQTRPIHNTELAIEAAREYLAQPESEARTEQSEPYAWEWFFDNGKSQGFTKDKGEALQGGEYAVPVYRHPAAQPKAPEPVNQMMLEALKEVLNHAIGIESLVICDISSAAIAAAEQAPQPKAPEPLTDTRCKVKLGEQYGSDLAGHWFFLQPADEFADKALEKHSGIAAQRSKE